MADDPLLTPKPYQHFVWQKYLKSWGENNAVWCLQGGRLFNTGSRQAIVRAAAAGGDLSKPGSRNKLDQALVPVIPDEA